MLALTEAEVNRSLAAAVNEFGSRHRNFTDTLEARFGMVAHRLPDATAVSAERRQLIGAYFSQEYAIEAAALFNPSMVAHPDQSGLAPGTTRFVMSVRGVGEGHISSVEFRTGTITETDDLSFDDPGPCTVLPSVVPTTYAKTVFAHQHAELGGGPDQRRLRPGRAPRFLHARRSRRRPDPTPRTRADPRLSRPDSRAFRVDRSLQLLDHLPRLLPR